MNKPLGVGDRVALTADFVKFTCGAKHEFAALRGEIIAICGQSLAVVQWDGVSDEEANNTYNLANICRIRSVAFREVKWVREGHTA